jgi:hypothetical protein
MHPWYMVQSDHDRSTRKKNGLPVATGIDWYLRREKYKQMLKYSSDFVTWLLKRVFEW